MRGSSRRVLGAFLTWLAEKHSRVFVVATANDITALPPELIRKGRFDEIFFVDLPDQKTRADILRIHAARRGISLDAASLEALAKSCDGFPGAEARGRRAGGPSGIGPLEAPRTWVRGRDR